MSAERAPQTIELRVERVAQLFATLDPFPFPERDLDHDAEEFIVGWARELPHDHPIHIIVHLPQSEAAGEHAQKLGESIRRYFAYRAKMMTLDLKELFRIGRQSLIIGAAVLALCILAVQGLPRLFNDEAVAQYMRESLLILGWVANWRPIEILLYEWWPIVRRRNLLNRLARARVDLKPISGHALEPASLPGVAR